ncbi:DUF1802 family protein [Planctomicrobium sp. SH668]|uniref:DUF1802 family protein n=1 Tax=Planctomicrobium sp. SH668 TaxID=3448126 RepID=UPI003F5B10DB
MQHIAKPTNHIALKEWAVVCAALASGSQKILFRKGGIHEGPAGFQPEHSEFWLYPTGFHQSADGVRDEFRSQAEELLSSPVQPDCVPIQFYCRIDSVNWLSEESELPVLESQHILKPESVLTRFHYRKPGLYVLNVTTFRLQHPISVPHSLRYDGCHSWVELDESLPTQDLLESA